MTVKELMSRKNLTKKDITIYFKENKKLFDGNNIDEFLDREMQEFHFYGEWNDNNEINLKCACVI
jgi:hypothetical protein